MKTSPFSIMEVFEMSRPDPESLLSSLKRISEEYQLQLERMARSLVPVYEHMRKIQVELGALAQELLNQFKEAIEKGIENFQTPEKYVSSKVKVYSWTKELTNRESVDMLDELGASYFGYMIDRCKQGLDAHFKGEYQLSIFTFLSLTDGILKEFCRMHKQDDCIHEHANPTFEKSLQHFVKHYKLEAFVTKERFQNRLNAFFEHRNHIMHGDRQAFFDENISVIALLFLVLVFTVVTKEIGES
jgi:hypothetical protein